MRRNKFNARKTTIDGIKFDSAREAKRWGELKLLEGRGAIRSLERQVSLPLVLPNGVPIKTPTGRTMRYIADFTYFTDKERVYEDSKGFREKASILKIAVVEAIYGVKVKLV